MGGYSCLEFVGLDVSPEVMSDLVEGVLEFIVDLSVIAEDEIAAVDL